MKKTRWGIIGTGRIAKVFAEALKVTDNSELVAVGSRKIETAVKFAEEFNIHRSYTNYEEVVQDKEVDVVYIATPHNLHCQNTLMALENNKHVLCEKPFGVNGKEVRMMIAKAKEKNLFLMEALWSRFLPNIIRTKELIDSGEIGKVKLLTAYFAFKSNQGLEHRQFNKDLCGGSLLDIGIYNVFLTLFLLGKPISFKASAGLGVTGTDNSCSVIFNYNDDTLAVTHSSFMASTPIIAEIHGETGKIFLEDRYFCPGNIKLNRYNGDEVLLPIEIKGNGYNYEAEEVVKCIQEGKIQSDMMSWEKSLELIDMLDSIRKECGIIYPKHDN
jgi:scyllo-inositol 2-dehydrogenase (NADP+)